MKKLNEGYMPEEPYTLVGIDGNAFSIMGFVARIMRQHGHSRDEIEQYRKEAMSSDYNNLLCISMDMVDMINNELGFDDMDVMEESVELDDLHLEADDILEVKHLLPVVGKARCLYITAEDFKELPFDLNDIKHVFANNPINVDAAICNGVDFQAVYESPYEGHKMLSCIAKSNGCVVSDLNKYVYTAEQFRDIYMESFKNLRARNHAVNENEYWDEDFRHDRDNYSDTAIRQIKKAIENAMITIWDEYGIEFSKTEAKEWVLQAAEEFDPETLSIASVMED